MRRDAKKDGNHHEIIAKFDSLGWTTHDLSQLKKCCDAVVCKNGLTVMIEIKDGSKPPSGRKLSEGEKQFRDKWQKNGFWALIETVNDVIELDQSYKFESWKCSIACEMEKVEGVLLTGNPPKFKFVCKNCKRIEYKRL